jgi:hypothetical protein
VAMARKTLVGWLPSEIYDEINRYIMADSKRRNKGSLVIALESRRNICRTIMRKISESHKKYHGEMWCRYHIFRFFSLFVYLSIQKMKLSTYVNDVQRRGEFILPTAACFPRTGM